MNFLIDSFIWSIISLIHFAKVNLAQSRGPRLAFELYLMKIWDTKAH